MAGSKSVIELLRGTDIFSDIEGEALKELAEESRIHNLSSRQSVFSEGFPGEYFFFLLEGSVRIFKTTHEGTETTIKIISSGELFAEVILFGSNIYPVSATAITPARVLGLSRSSFFRMLAHADARDRFIASLFKKLRYLSDQVHYLNSHDVEERFFRFLKEHYGEKETYTIHLPKKEIAAAIGTIPETFSRLVKRLSTLGLLTWKDDKLQLKKNFWQEFL